MKKKRDFQDYLQDILVEINYLIKSVDGLSYDEFSKNEYYKRSFVRSLEIIGEASKKIPFELRNIDNRIPWKQMAGLRDILSHHYFGIDYNTISIVVTKELVEIKPYIEDFIEKYSKSKLNGFGNE